MEPSATTGPTCRSDNSANVLPSSSFGRNGTGSDRLTISSQWGSTRQAYKPVAAPAPTSVSADRLMNRRRDTRTRLPRVRWRHGRAKPCVVLAVVPPRVGAGETNDHTFKAPEETERLERPIAPTGGDAIPAVVRPLMMYRMLSAPENQTRALEDARRHRRIGHVGPLVDLVREDGGAAHSQPRR